MTPRVRTSSSINNNSNNNNNNNNTNRRAVYESDFDEETLANVPAPAPPLPTMSYESHHKQQVSGQVQELAQEPHVPSLTSPRPAPAPPVSTIHSSAALLSLLPPPPLSPPPPIFSPFGSRTPMQMIDLSNEKLNNDLYSTRSLSIHRRILVKNFLTMLYDWDPLLDYWFEYGDDFGNNDNSACNSSHTEQMQNTTGNKGNSSSFSSGLCAGAGDINQ
ncbi:hypothetical protein BGZ94_000900, partial [Podila epigama]